MKLNSIPEVLSDLKKGRLVIVMDDAARENEGDLVVAAQHATPANVNFMAKHGRGIICVPMESRRLAELGVATVNLSGGSPYYCPHAQRPATFPPSDGYLPPEDPLASVWRMMDVARQCRQAFPAFPESADLSIKGNRSLPRYYGRHQWRLHRRNGL